MWFISITEVILFKSPQRELTVCDYPNMSFLFLLLRKIPDAHVWSSISLFYWLEKKKKKQETQVEHTHSYMCVCAYKHTDVYSRTHQLLHRWAHKQSLTTMQIHICTSGADTARWICVALWGNKRKNKLSSWIRGITTKSTIAERINKIEQDLPPLSDRSTDRQTGTNLLAFRSPTQFC